MLVGQLCSHTATGRTLNESLHDEERLVDLLYRTGILANGGGNRRDTYWTTTELVDDGQQYAVIYLVQSILVDVQGSQRHLRNSSVYPACTLHLSKVAHSAQQGIGNTGRSTRTAGYLQRGISRDRYTQDACRALYDALQGLRIVVLQMHIAA